MDSLAKKYPKYYKALPPGVKPDEIDTYVINQMFPVDDPTGTIIHARKKLLIPGVRSGGKSTLKDVIEARDTLNRYIALMSEPVEEEQSAVQQPRMLVMENELREYDTWYAYNADIGKMPEDLHHKSIVTMRRVNGETMGPQTADMVDWGLYRKRADEPRAWAGLMVHKIPPADKEGWIFNTGERPAWLPKGAIVEVLLFGSDTLPPKPVDDWCWKHDGTPSAINMYRPFT